MGRSLRVAAIALVVTRLAVLAALLAIGEDGLRLDLERWDAGWYAQVARFGYGADAPPTVAIGTPAFFPLLPAAEWALVEVFGGAGRAWLGDPHVWGAVVGTACAWLALALVHDETRQRGGEPAATLAVWAVALFPVSFVLSLGYTEAPFLLASLLCFRAARGGGVLVAALTGLASGLLRPTGWLLAPALALDAWRTPEGRPARIAGACGALLGPIAFFAWLRHERGSWTASLDAQRAVWDRVPLTEAPRALAEYVIDAFMDTRMTFLFSLAGVPLAVLLLWVLWRSGERGGAFLFALLVPLLALSTGSAMSLPRFLLGTWPYAVAAGLGLALLAPRWRYAALAASACAGALALWGTFGAGELPP